MAKVRIQPLSDRLVVKPADEQETMRGGLYIPDTAKEKPMQGEVVAAGPGKLGEDGKRMPMDAKVGDTVIYGKYSGNEFEVDGEKYLIVRQDDIYGLLTK